ncbi:MAG: cache domain-containing protein, partial [Kiritimatiellae bacterium]|nr:cache domain-containing protein [Kiritimatiellia bacterium]
MLLNRSIAVRLALLVVLGAGCILSAIIGYSYVRVRRMLMDDLETKARYMASATVNRIETTARSVEKAVQGMTVGLEMQSLSTNDMYQLLRRTVEQNRGNIYGAAIALNPSLNGQNPACCAPYVFNEKGQLVCKDLGADDYRYDTWDWFYLPQKLKEPVWCEPYFDEGGGGILMVTYSCPVFKSNEFYGVVTSDVSLEGLSGLLASLLKKEVGYAWLISANGTFIAHPRRELIMNETVFSTAEINPDPLVRSAGWRAGRRMVRG